MNIPSLNELKSESKKEPVKEPLGLAVTDSMRIRFCEIKKKYEDAGVNPRKVNQLVRDRLDQIFDELERNLSA